MTEKVKLRITTMSPVTIGSGSELSPYADYVIDSNQVCFINKKEMVDKIMAKGDILFDHYINGVATMMDNNRSNFDLKSFLLNNRIVKEISELVDYRCPLVGNPDSKLPIKGLLKSSLQEPYFAGSSVKGGLKTVLMYHWLKTNKSAGAKIEEVIHGAVVYGQPKSINFDWLEKEFECYVDAQGQFIRPNTIQQVTDSSLIPKEHIVVVDSFRNMPIRLECIAKGNMAEFALTLENYKWEDLAKQANDYIIAGLTRELDILDNLDQEGKLSTYYNQVDTFLADHVEKADKNTAYLRIGFGKGHYLNSLGMAIYDYVNEKGIKELYREYESYIKSQFPKSGESENFSLANFPLTRLYVSSSQEPLGLVRIEIC